MGLEEQIRELAYAIWEQEGRLEGKDSDYYFRAKQILEEQGAALSPTKEPVPSSSILQPTTSTKTNRAAQRQTSRKVKYR